MNWSRWFEDLLRGAEATAYYGLIVFCIVLVLALIYASIGSIILVTKHYRMKHHTAREFKQIVRNY